jgi:hypothetical protein
VAIGNTGNFGVGCRGAKECGADPDMPVSTWHERCIALTFVVDVPALRSWVVSARTENSKGGARLRSF